MSDATLHPNPFSGLRSPRALAEVATATFLFSALGLFAKLIDHGPFATTSVRGMAMLVGVIALLPILRWRPPRLTPTRVGALLVIGALNAGNWGLFFVSVQLSTVAVAMVALFTYPLLTALLEPVFFREKPHAAELIAGAAVLGGVIVLTPSFDLGDDTTLGIVAGLGSSLCLTLRNIASRRMVRETGSVSILLSASIVGALIFLPWLVAEGEPWDARDIGLVLLLGAVFTVGAQLLFLDSLKKMSTRVASLLISLQPPVAALLAWAVLGETPTMRTVIGGALITAAVIGFAAYRIATEPDAPSEPVLER